MGLALRAVAVGVFVGFSVLFALPGWAAERSGYYAGARLVGSVAEVNDVRASGFTGRLIGNSGSDLVGGPAGVLGYRWPGVGLRTELEVALRYRFDWGSRDGGPPAVGYENNLQSTNVLFNALIEFGNPSNIVPFLGATIGWAGNRSKVERNALATGVITKKSHTVHNLAMGIMAGVEWAFGRRWSLELSYRYIDLGEAATGRFATGEEIEAEEYISHDLMLTLMYLW